MSYTLFPHQQRSLDLMKTTPHVFDLSSAGTGKTLTQIAAIQMRKDIKRTLVIAPKSILVSAWQNDFKKFAPEITTVVANAANRKKAFGSTASVVITNTDAVTWLVKHPHIYLTFDNIVVDESDSFRNPTSLRSKALTKITAHAKYRSLLSATPAGNGVTDLWQQMMVLDRGATLGTSFYRFRGECCTPTQQGPSAAHMKWTDKPGIEGVVAAMLDHLTIRNKLEDCIDIPELQEFTVPYKLSTKQRKAYDQMRKHGMTMLENGELITAMQRSTVLTKLRQIASGAAYDENGKHQLVEVERYELIVELALRVPHSIIFFEWEHLKEGVSAVLNGLKETYGIIDGSVSDKARIATVDAYQRGELRTLLIHPKSGAHGLTLTRGTRVIWTAPVYSHSMAYQGNGRVYRNGQQQKTQVITIIADDTVDTEVYAVQTGKRTAQEALLTFLE